MKTCKIFILLLVFSACCLNYAQPNYSEINKTCGDISISTATIPSLGTLRALVIYVQYSDDAFESYPATNDWPANVGNWQLPSWAYDVLSPTVQSQYTNPSLSGYFHSMSLGNFELIGEEYPTNGFPYVTQNNTNYYYSNDQSHQQCLGSHHLSEAVYEALQSLDPLIDFSNYDSNQDGYVDLIIMWFRFHNSGCTSFGGFSGIANLLAGNNVFIPGVTEITTQDGGVKIRGSSGVVVEGTSSRGVNLVAHEITHLMGFPHDQWQGYYSLMTWEGMGITNSYERMNLGWINTSTQLKTINTTQLDYQLRDFETFGEAVKIPINTTDYYLLEYRQRTGAGFYSSDNWTKWAAGHGYPEGPAMIPDEGLIINKYTFSAQENFQIQCADHKWIFEEVLTNLFAYPFKKLYPSIDNNAIFEMDLFNNNHYRGNCVDIVGEDIVCIDRIRKYHEDAWGDDNDLWKIGYNEVFSNWTNPKSALSNLSIQIKSVNSQTKTMYLDIRFENPENAAPSKPLYLRVEQQQIYGNPPGDFNPILRWNKNTEPDMQSNAFYNIYRADLTGNSVYYYLATIPFPSLGLDVEYIDYSLVLYDINSSQIAVCWNRKKFGYKVQAVDNQTQYSVLSDEGTIDGYEDPCSGEDGDNSNNISSNLPKKYKFYNYPNPFNPSTEIRFSLPKDEIVTIKIYDLLGEEVKILVNHVYKSAGKYSIKFDGTNYASGLYLYRIEAGNYTETKKMLLVK